MGTIGRATAHFLTGMGPRRQRSNILKHRKKIAANLEFSLQSETLKNLDNFSKHQLNNPWASRKNFNKKNHEVEFFR